MLRFVIQEHYARSHHFDFRLEQNGVFRSWAVPKGIPVEAGIKRLAVQVQDHALVFGDFEGKILPGEYGAGQIRIWDKGEFELVEWFRDRISFTLFGTKVRGDLMMVRFSSVGRQLFFPQGRIIVVDHSSPESKKWLIFLSEPKGGK
jgi:DNA ligase D-like protein (predicted 3'-phosphoesterase)